ncbi:MAG: GldG family protein [Deferrisomatales bacterium]|nr:GldG family protein [Deferrisomatales bacterium]
MRQLDHPRVTTRTTSKLAGIGGALLVLAALFVASYYPDQRGILAVLGVVGAAALLFFFIAERRLVAGLPGSRTARYGANAAVMTLAFVGILVILNVLAIRHNARWDLTADRRFTLSDQTLKVLRALEREVVVTAFFSDASEARVRIKRLLDDFSDHSSRVRVSFVDPDRNPALAQQHGIREYGTTVFASGEQTYRITETTEEAATNALVRVTREGQKTICFLSGHGERAVYDSQRRGYSSAGRALEEQGYAVREILLLRETEVPAECAVLVIAGPTKPLLDPERELLGTYLEEGGKALVLVDPQTETGLEPLLEQWGIRLRDDVIIDTMSRLFGGSYTTPIITDYPPHEVTQGFQLATFLAVARSLEESRLPEGASFHPLARTTPQSWGETDLQGDQAAFDPAEDHKGPLTVAALVERTGDDGLPGTQLIVVGDSDFADNTYFGYSGNGDLFQNLVSYLAKEEDLISIRPRDARPSPLMLSRAQGATLFYGSVVVGPLLLVLAGLGIWWRRRNL